MQHKPVLDYTQMEHGHALYKETYETALSLGLPIIETLPLSYVPASKLSHLRTFGDYSITYAGRDLLFSNVLSNLLVGSTRTSCMRWLSRQDALSYSTVSTENVSTSSLFRRSTRRCWKITSTRYHLLS
jgi:hypothetical protein